MVATGPAEPIMAGGRNAFQEVLDTGATAVVAYNDLMAIGLLLASGEKKISVPDRLSIIGFDDIFGARFTSPPLTTIRTPLALVGEEAIRQLTLVDSDKTMPASAALQTEFVLRKSTGPVPPAKF